MCWSASSSLAAAVYGYSACTYLIFRNHSVRDFWYAMFLASFTTTQVMDAFFWTIQVEEKDLPCSVLSMSALATFDTGAWNLFISRFLLPPVFFSQLIVVSYFPSYESPNMRWPYRVLVIFACMIPMWFIGCTTILPRRSSPAGLFGGSLLPLPSLVWGGIQPPLPLFFVSLVLAGLGCVLFLRPHAVWISIFCLGGFNLCLLQLIDGNITLISKLCFWCVLLSFLFGLEPLWLSPQITTLKSEKKEFPLKGLFHMMLGGVIAIIVPVAAAHIKIWLASDQ